MPPNRHNLAARMGRWSAEHWKTATVGWLAFVLVAFALGSMVGTKQVDQNAPGPGESGRMQKILDAGFKQPVGESVLIQSRSAHVGDPAFTAATRDFVLLAAVDVISPSDLPPMWSASPSTSPPAEAPGR